MSPRPQISNGDSCFIIYSTLTLDVRTLDRVSEVRVEPVGGQLAEPFHVTATVSFRWSALHAARAATNEEDLLIELLGHSGADDRDTDPSWVRVDIELRATLPHGRPLPMPTPARWADWAREEGSPSATFRCGEDGSFSLDRIELEAWQAIVVPRRWDDPTRSPEEPPDDQLDRMLARVRSALHVWSELLDHLVA